MSKHVVKGVVWDLDGTLTIPVLDFKIMRQRTGILTGDLLVHADASALAIIEEMEAEAVAKMQLQPHCLEVLRYFQQRHIPMGILSRNSSVSLRAFVEFVDPDIRFTHVLSRDHPPFKPDPHNIIHMARDWNVPLHNVVMVGDARDDVLAGFRAGAHTVLLTHDTPLHVHLSLLEEARTENEKLHGVQISPTCVVKNLSDFVAAFENTFEV
eukprot:ANDGO_05552.mRNA.1 Haloacid dehalogenase-like hydrolase domain-containing protein At2g33255